MNTTTALVNIDRNGKSTDIVLKGKTVGTRFELGVGVITDCRKALRASGLSANDANAKMNEWLKGSGGNVAWAQAQTRLETARARGMFPTVFEDRAGTFCLRGAKAPVVKETKAAKLDKDAVAAMSADDKNALLALLMADMKPAK